MNKIILSVLLGCIAYADIKKGNVLEVTSYQFKNGLYDSSYLGEPLLVTGKEYPVVYVKRIRPDDITILFGLQRVTLNTKKADICMKYWPEVI